AIETFDSDRASIDRAVQKIAALAAGPQPSVDALFIPARGDALIQIAQRLGAVNFNPQRVRPIGTGQWSDSRLYSVPQFQGAWSAAPDSAGFEDFAARYRQRFNSAPARIGTLSYDAVSLASALVRTQGPRRFAEETLTSPSGFGGADGL